MGRLADVSSTPHVPLRDLGHHPRPTPPTESLTMQSRARWPPNRGQPHGMMTAFRFSEAPLDACEGARAMLKAGRRFPLDQLSIQTHAFDARLPILGLRWCHP